MKSLKYILGCLSLSLAVLSSSAQETNQITIYHSQLDQIPSMRYTPHADDQIKIEPDTEAPCLIAVPEGNKYFSLDPSYNTDLKFWVNFNEAITLGEGAISYTVTGEDGKTPYAFGLIDNGTIVVSRGILSPEYRPDNSYSDYSGILLPIPNGIFRRHEKSYIYFDFAEGAFVDFCGNPSAAMKGGRDENGAVNAPWGDYTPDLIAPHLIRIPESYKYNATNDGRSITVEFNEVIKSRGKGAITYTITGEDGKTSYANGTIDNIVIDDYTLADVTLTLPASVTFDKNQSVSYIFLDFEEGAFIDFNDNPSVAMKGGLDEDGVVNAPWWEYIPDREAPYLINIPMGYKYKSFNNWRSITLVFNEEIARGQGDITYTITDEYGMTSYANGTIESVSIDGNNATITLPENAAFDDTKECSYIFLDLEEGAFVDASGNAMIELIGGANADGVVNAPWWEYDPNQLQLVLDEEGYGQYAFTYHSATANQNISEAVTITLGSNITSNPQYTYGIYGLASYIYDENSETSYIGAEILNNEFAFYHLYAVGYTTYQDQQLLICPAGIVLDEQGDPTSIYDSDYIIFTPSTEDPRILETNVVMAYLLVNPEGNIIGFADTMTDCKFVPQSLVDQVSLSYAAKPAKMKQVNVEKIKQFVLKNFKKPMPTLKRLTPLNK